MLARELLYAVLLASVLTVAVGQLNFKLYFRARSRLRLLFAMALFVIAQVGFWVSLTGLEIGTVYMATSLTHVAVLLLAAGVLGERLSRDHLIAVTLIVAGVALYGAGS